MAHAPFFSIVIPAYNCENYINAALDSINSQSCVDWEILVAADTTSSDRTVFACTSQTIVPNDKIKVVPVGHIGQYLARRLLVESSRGKIVVSLDADDELIDRDALQKIKDVAQREACDMVLFNATKSKEQVERIVDYSFAHADDAGKVDAGRIKKHMLLSYELNNIWLKAFNRSKASFAFTDRILHNTEDRLQCIELIQNIDSCYLIDEPFYYYRPNQSSVTQSSYKYSYFEDALYVEAKANELLLPFFGGESSLEQKRRRFVSSTVAMLLQLLFESSNDKSLRLKMYESIRAYGLKLEVIPERAGRIRPDYAIAYTQFIRSRFRILDGFLSIRAKIRSHVSADEQNDGGQG